MSSRRLGLAALLMASVAGPAASEPEACGGSAEPKSAATRKAEPGAPAVLERAPEEALFPRASRQAGVPDGAVFRRGGSWTRLEGSLLVGSQLVDQDLGFARNIFQTVSAEADDVGFGEHYGARASLFAVQYLGVEASYTRTTTAFEFSVTDEEAGTFLLEPLLQESRELSLALVAQLPLAAMTPYAVVGYGWRNSEVEGGDEFRTGAAMFGVGLKVPFPTIPVSLAFDYRRLGYPGGEGALHLAEGAGGAAIVSALTMGVTVRVGRLR